MVFKSFIFITFLGAVSSSLDQIDNSQEKRKLPYQVSVEVYGEFRCTGAIINMLWVAVADPCLHDASAEDVIVRAATDVPRRRGVAHRVRQLLTSPQASCSSEVACPQGSLTLLKIYTRFEFSWKIRPVTLWPRPPPAGDTGWVATWPCHEDWITIDTQRRVRVRDPKACSEATSDPVLMCVSVSEPRTRRVCQNVGALVVIRDRLAGFLLHRYNSSIGLCVPISSYISWIKRTAFGFH